MKAVEKRIVLEPATTGTITREAARAAIRAYLESRKATDPPPAST
jgi:hypothetical protein